MRIFLCTTHSMRTVLIKCKIYVLHIKKVSAVKRDDTKKVSKVFTNFKESFLGGGGNFQRQKIQVKTLLPRFKQNRLDGYWWFIRDKFDRDAFRSVDRTFIKLTTCGHSNEIIISQPVILQVSLRSLARSYLTAEIRENIVALLHAYQSRQPGKFK